MSSKYKDLYNSTEEFLESIFIFRSIALMLNNFFLKVNNKY